MNKLSANHTQERKKLARKRKERKKPNTAALQHGTQHLAIQFETNRRRDRMIVFNVTVLHRENVGEIKKLSS